MKKSVFNELLESVQQMDTIVKSKQKGRHECSKAAPKSDKYASNKVETKNKASDYK